MNKNQSEEKEDWKKESKGFQLPLQKRIIYKLRLLKPLSFIKANIVILAFILPIAAILVIFPVVLDSMEEPSENLKVLKSQVSVTSISEVSSVGIVSTKIDSEVSVISKEVIVETSEKESSFVSKNSMNSKSVPKITKAPSPVPESDIIEERSKKTMINTSSYFNERTTYLEEAMKKSKYYYETILLDPETKTYAYILAIDKNFASNLYGFYYYLIDETASTSLISPVVLNLSILFDEDNREKCVLKETFAQEDLLESFDLSLQALLGEYYKKDITNFIYEEYRGIFKTRLAGKKLPIYTKELSCPGIDIVFRSSFMTYVEFFLVEEE